MAKKDTKLQINVSQQLKQFSKNIGEDGDDIVPVPREYFKKKIVEPIIEPTDIFTNFVKIPKDELIQLVQSIPTIQTQLKHDILEMVYLDYAKSEICAILDQIQTFDLVRINTIKQNLQNNEK